MPVAAALVIETTPEGVSLERYSATGEFAGDTWHPTVDEAVGQAEFEFPGRLTAWRSVPRDVDDAIGLALQMYAELCA